MFNYQLIFMTRMAMSASPKKIASSSRIILVNRFRLDIIRINWSMTVRLTSASYHPSPTSSIFFR